MKHMHTFESFLNEAKDSEYVDQDRIRAARGIVTGLTPGKYKLTQDVEAWVVDMKDQEESTTWIGKSNVPRVKLEKVKLKKGTSLERTAFGEEVYLEGNKDNPVWLVDPRIFDPHNRRGPKDAHYEELRKIAKIIEK